MRDVDKGSAILLLFAFSFWLLLITLDISFSHYPLSSSPFGYFIYPSLSNDPSEKIKSTFICQKEAENSQKTQILFSKYFDTYLNEYNLKKKKKN